MNVNFLTVITPNSDSTPPAFKPYTVKVTDPALNIRKAPGTNNAVVAVIKDKGIYTIVEETTVNGGNWGKLKSGLGWIALNLTEKI